MFSTLVVGVTYLVIGRPWVQPTRLSRVQSLAYTKQLLQLTLKHLETQEAPQHKIQAIKQHYNTYTHSVDRRRLLSLQVSHIYRTSMGGSAECSLHVFFSKQAGSVSTRTQCGEGNKCQHLQFYNKQDVWLIYQCLVLKISSQGQVRL